MLSAYLLGLYFNVSKNCLWFVSIVTPIIQGCARPFFSIRDWDRDLGDTVSRLRLRLRLVAPGIKSWDRDWDFYLWSQILRLRLRLLPLVSNLETETFTFGLKSWDWDWDFYLWSQILRLRLFILVSNIETGTETLLQSSVFSGTYVASSSFIGRFYQDHLWTNP